MFKRLEVMCIRDLVKSEGWSRESFLEAMSEPRLTRKEKGSEWWRGSVLGSGRQ